MYRNIYMRKNILLLFSLLVIIVLDSYAVLDENLVLYLPFDEGKGDIAKDTTKHKNNGQLHQVEWAKGKYGTAVEFSGVKGGWVEVPDAPSLDITDEITLMLWVHPTQFTGEWLRMLVKTWAGDGEPWMVYGLYQEGGTQGKVGFILSVDKAKEKRSPHGPPIKKEEWTHLAATYDGQVQKIYYNGTLKESQKVTGKIDTNDVPISVGRNNEGDREHYVGLIDEVAIWNKALTKDEIREAMESVASVEAKNKLSTRWGAIKGLYMDTK